jgi:transaldolase/glucose-6-phosphate isomerase
MINRPNLLISLPVNQQTIPLLGNLLVQGVNVDASMICSLEQYLSVVEVYLRSLESRLDAGNGIEHIVSVASFFIGDIDEHVNRRLESFTGEGVEARRAGALVDEIGLAIAKLAYAQFNVSFEDERFSRLAQAGGRRQRPLWARLDGNKSVRPQEYIQKFVSPRTIIAASSELLESGRSELDLRVTLDEGLSEARGKLQALTSIGILMEQIALDIERSRFEQRRQAYLGALSEVSTKTNHFQLELGPIQEAYRKILDELDSNDVSRRIWQADASLWSQDRRKQKNISGLFGWLELSGHISSIMEECQAVSKTLVSENFTKLSLVCPGSIGSLMHALGEQFTHPSRDLILIEPNSPERLVGAKGVGSNGNHYLFIVDRSDNEFIEKTLSSTLDHLREGGVSDPDAYVTIIAQPEVLQAYQKAGRDSWRSLTLPKDVPLHFSGLSYPGLLVASWLDVDLVAIRDGVVEALNRCLPAVPVERNPAIALASVIEAGLRSAFDTLELAADSCWSSYLPWIEGLISECGLLRSSEVYIDDRGDHVEHKPNDQSVSIFLRDSTGRGVQLDDPAGMGRPVKILDLPFSAEGVGTLFALVQFTFTVLGHLQGLNPFETRLEQ